RSECGPRDSRRNKDRLFNAIARRRTRKPALADVPNLCHLAVVPMASSRPVVQPLRLYRLPPRDRSAPTTATEDCVVALKALAEDTRVRIVSLLMERQLDVGEIADELGITHYNVSKHLRVLRESGLLEVGKDGRRHVFRLSDRIGRPGEVN